MIINGSLIWAGFSLISLFLNMKLTTSSQNNITNLVLCFTRENDKHVIAFITL
jgi:hypothetical protein